MGLKSAQISRSPRWPGAEARTTALPVRLPLQEPPARLTAEPGPVRPKPLDGLEVGHEDGKAEADHERIDVNRHVAGHLRPYDVPGR
jgi:hypothetical protein